MERSLFERLAAGGCPVAMLSMQYRMHPVIRQVSAPGTAQEYQCGGVPANVRQAGLCPDLQPALHLTLLSSVPAVPLQPLLQRPAAGRTKRARWVPFCRLLTVPVFGPVHASMRFCALDTRLAVPAPGLSAPRSYPLLQRGSTLLTTSTTT